MKVENAISRRNGFIISDGAFAPQKPRIKKPDLNASNKLFSAAGLAFENAAIKTSAIAQEYTAQSRALHKRAVKTILSCLIAVSCLLVFFKFFTFATAIYSSGKCVAVSASDEIYKEALTNVQLSYGENLDKHFRTSTVLVLKSKVDKPQTLSDKLLLCSPDYCYAYSLYSDGEAVFTAKTEKAAKKALSEYVTRLSMDGDAEVASKIEIKRIVAQKNDISTTEECIEVLSQKNSVPVVSVVSSSIEEEIPFETQTKSDDTLYIGESVTESEGTVGKRLVMHETRYENGTQTSSGIASDNIVVEPVNRVVRVGTKQKEILKTGVLPPLEGRVSSNFGARWGSVHEGVDIAVPTGTSVKAAECGSVSYVSENAGGYGKLVRIDHGYGVETAYAHLSQINVQVGQKVSAGQEIALSGNTGRSTGPHLHFEIIDNGTKIDPVPYINKRAASPSSRAD